MNTTSFTFFCGIDISKNSLDFTLIDQNKNILLSTKVSNDKKGIKNIFNHLKKENIELNKILFCCENTGIYTTILTSSLLENNCKLWIEHPISIIRSQGLTRGKTDKIDSHRISLYALRFRDKRVISNPSNKNLEKLKHLNSLRDRLQKSLKVLKVPIKELENIVDKKFHLQLKKIGEGTLNSLKTDLKEVDKELENIIKSDIELSKNYKIAMSVPCIGRISAMYLLISTNNFIKIKTYRQGASYAGIAPFSYSSGTSIRGKTRVSPMGNKYLKKLLHMCSLSVLKHKTGELYEYFKRKLESGKHTMSVLNALRNKLLNRVFACVNNGIEYKNNYLKRAN